MNIDRKIHEYLEHSKLTKKIGSYEYDKSKIYHFKKWLDSNKRFTELEQIDIGTINDYLFHLKKTCVNNTINKHLKVLKLFYKTIDYEFEELQSIKNLKERKVSFEMIDFELLQPMKEYVLSLDDDFGNNLLYKAIFCLLVDTGARISEILAIEKSNINMKHHSILLKETKNSDERYVFFTDGLSGLIIKKILAKNTKGKYLLHDYIKNTNATYGQAKYFISNQLKNQFDLQKLHPHMFRHTVATYWLEHGADIHFVQKILGHRNIKSTLIYTHTSFTHRMEMYNKVSFKGK